MPHCLTLQVPHYLGGQYLGALLASCSVFLVYWDALVYYEHDRWVAGCGQEVQQLCRGGYRTTPDTAAIFSTYPAPHLTLAGGIIDQVTIIIIIIIIIMLRPARWW